MQIINSKRDEIVDCSNLQKRLNAESKEIAQIKRWLVLLMICKYYGREKNTDEKMENGSTEEEKKPR